VVSDRSPPVRENTAAATCSGQYLLLQQRAPGIVGSQVLLGHADLFGAAHNKPTAVFCANDVLALGLLRGLGQAGVSVPGDLAVVGYDGIEFAADAAVPLTSVRQPKYQLGRAAAELLLDEADRPAEHEHRRIVFTPELVVRASSGSGLTTIAEGS
jgi:LacI family transcriptional regulator